EERISAAESNRGRTVFGKRHRELDEESTATRCRRCLRSSHRAGSRSSDTARFGTRHSTGDGISRRDGKEKSCDPKGLLALVCELTRRRSGLRSQGSERQES